MCQALFLRVNSTSFHYSRQQGAAGNVIVLQPTKTAMTFSDIDLGRRVNVPANHVIIPPNFVVPTGLGVAGIYRRFMSVQKILVPDLSLYLYHA